MIEERHIRHLWDKMTRIYGHAWVSGYGAEDDGTWLTGLRHCTPQMIGHGIDRCIELRAGDWPPSLPEFRRLCMDIPSKDEAIVDAMRPEPLTEIGRELRNSIPSFDRQRLSANEMRAQYRSLYDEVLREANKLLLEDKR